MTTLIDSVKELIHLALEEDLGTGDITSNNIITDNKIITSKIIFEEPGIFCGQMVLDELCSKFSLNIPNKITDGSQVNKGDFFIISGNAKDILTSERLILNFLSFLSGISTETKRYVEKSRVDIFDTRKTIPGLRRLQKYAVKVGGGHNHRMGLYDMAIIKDNHKEVFGLEKAIHKLQDINIEVECDNIHEVEIALKNKIKYILLDNMSIEQLKESVKLIRKLNNKVIIEASGGVTLDTVDKISETGVDRISVGAITSNIKPLKMKLEI